MYIDIVSNEQDIPINIINLLLLRTQGILDVRRCTFFKGYYPTYTLEGFDLTTHSSSLNGDRRRLCIPLDHAARGQFFKTSVGANTRVGANSAECHSCIGASSPHRRKNPFKKLSPGR
jgi:hypothetical protein